MRFYNKRGTAEQWIKEGKQAVKMTRLSCHRFRSNEVRPLQVSRTRGGRLRAARTIPERKNALEGLGRRQKRVCSQVLAAKMAIPVYL